MKQNFGDARRGFVYSRIRNFLITLSDMPFKAKNWRPTIAVLTGNLLENKERLDVLKFAVDFEGGKGIVSIVEIIEGDFEELVELKISRENDMKMLLKENQIISAFPEVLVAKDFDSGLSALLQTHSIGPIKPNIIMMGCPKGEDRKLPFVKHLRMIQKLRKSFIILKSGDASYAVEKSDGDYIDIWWRGLQNGSLMLILAYLLQHNPVWKDLKIRIIRTIREESEQKIAKTELSNMVRASRIEAEVRIVISDNYKKTLHECSSNSAAVFLGAYVPDESNISGFFSYLESVSKNMPPIFFIYSSGDADLLA